MYFAPLRPEFVEGSKGSAPVRAPRGRGPAARPVIASASVVAAINKRFTAVPFFFAGEEATSR